MEIDIIELLVEMGNLVQTEFNKALTAFKNKDAELANKIDKIDDAVDDLQKTVFRKFCIQRQTRFTGNGCTGRKK